MQQHHLLSKPTNYQLQSHLLFICSQIRSHTGCMFSAVVGCCCCLTVWQQPNTHFPAATAQWRTQTHTSLEFNLTSTNKWTRLEIHRKTSTRKVFITYCVKYISVQVGLWRLKQKCHCLHIQVPIMIPTTLSQWWYRGICVKDSDIWLCRQVWTVMKSFWGDLEVLRYMLLIVGD